MDKFLLSVIIPVYNCEKYVERAIRSVVLQPNADKIEILIVNDGSTDNTANVLNKCSSQYANIKVIHKANGGVSSARNIAIEQANGKYIAFLDADDFWSENFLTDDLVGELENTSIEMYEFSCKTLNKDLTYEKTRKVRNETLLFENRERFRYDYSYFCAFLYAKNLLLKYNLRFLPTKVNEDQPFVEMCLYLANGLKRIDKVIFNYWSNESSCLHTNKGMIYICEVIKSFDIVKRWFNKYGEEYNNDYSMFMIFNMAIRDLCLDNKFKECVEKINAIKEFDVLRRYCEYPLTKRLKKTAKQWVNHPKWFWVKARLIYGVKIKLKNFAYKHNFIKKPLDIMFYKKRGYVKSNLHQDKNLLI